jgi:hypothetical protein
MERLGTVRAPEFPPGLRWFGVSRPLDWADLRGSFIFLEFFTYG